MRDLVELRVRTRIHPDELQQKIGKIITERDINVLLLRDTRVLKPNGQPLLVYLRDVIPEDIRNDVYPVLHSLKNYHTDNRGLASGSQHVRVGRQMRATPVASSIIGAIDPQGGRHPYCRLTAWTGKHTAEYKQLYPYFQEVANIFQQYVPERYAVQADRAAKSHPDWVIPGSPYTTVTVNNTYATGVHQDAGDLKEGFSCLTTLRRGQYTGGYLCFPEYRVGIEMRDGDVVLMDAHEWHGNTNIDPQSSDAERISVVLYYRSDIVECGSLQDEVERAKQKTGGILIGVDED